MSYSATAISPTTIRFSVQYVSGYSWYEIAYRPNTTLEAQYIKIQRTSDFTYDLTGLTPGTTYVVNVAYSTIFEGGFTFMGGQTITMPEQGTVTHWSWTTAEREAFTNHGSCRVIAYTRWNELCEKIVEIHTAHGSTGTWNSHYLSLDDTKMTAYDKTLTAARFNSLRYNIGTHYSTGIQEVSTGDIVMGEYFIKLETAINGWIDAWFG